MNELEHWMPLSHWTNFTLKELKAILAHYDAIEQLGIEPDTELITSIKRDIALREKKVTTKQTHNISAPSGYTMEITA